MSSVINFAHRGASAVCPENTMEAFTEAVRLGATGIETDVQMTADGRLVLIHDEKLDRTTSGRGLVKDIALDELSRLDAGAWRDEAFAGARVPLLEELLELAAAQRLQLNLELKNGIVRYPGLEEAVLGAVRQYGLQEQVVISSFNHYSLVACKQIDPAVRTGALYGEGLFEPWAYARRIGADALHAHHYAVLPEWVTAARAHGVVYHPYTVNDPARMDWLVEAGVAGIITDVPDVLAGLLRTRTAASQ
ncbi:glycerophosphodiester phosphodiesterase [Paenibacillus sp. IB182496]|uniref:Glycerophosphodiester phosphodiesterase n=1 Tax=Paenibacillus sabuli TaxID=2772509 RepID=A0A927BSL3_9BACL|nr:glycerophosphodiester phosphodiesterase [Paenibacillus sabuli]MBD2844789.1 glycerophosphodiester phosphodiesterase [Paenibacillus sabuli]